MKHTPGIIEHKKWEQENQEFRIILRYKEILKTTWTKWDHGSKKLKNE